MLATDFDQVYHMAVARIEAELGWSASTAQTALSEYATAYGVLPREIAMAVLTADSLKRGLGYVMSSVDFSDY
jgi:hypothetical protein